MTASSHRIPAILLFAAFLFGDVSAVGAGVNHDHLPRTVLFAEGERQRGRLFSSMDSTSHGDECSSGHGDGVPIPPKQAIETSGGPFRGRIVLRRDDRPRMVKLQGYTDTDETTGYVSEPAQPVDWRLVRRPAGDSRKWVVKFGSSVEDHLYLRLDASWRNPGGCGGDRGSWLFHVRAEGSR